MNGINSYNSSNMKNILIKIDIMIKKSQKFLIHSFVCFFAVVVIFVEDKT